MLRILIVDDNKNKNRWIRDILDKEKIQCIEDRDFMNAVSRIKYDSYLYDGIILDMKFLKRITDSKAEGRMGEKFLEFLKENNFDIPVLGNSTVEFRNAAEYPFFKGNTYGYCNPKILNQFLESLKDGE